MPQYDELTVPNDCAFDIMPPLMFIIGWIGGQGIEMRVKLIVK